MANTTATKSKSTTNVWSDAEKAAMRAGASEKKKSAKLTPAEERAAGEADIREKIAGMPEPDRSMAQRIHELVLAAAPELTPRTYYGMPAYAKDGKTICFFKPASKFKERYSTFGFEQAARLDDGNVWPASYAVTKLTPADEQRITELVRKAAG
jgi:uncharacterized protein YdhG (YjbR/CyaY superfamily)